MNAIEVLKELNSGGYNLIKPAVRFEAIKKALLALGRKEDDRKQGAVEELEKWLKEIDNYTTSHQFVLTRIEMKERLKELKGEQK